MSVFIVLHLSKFSIVIPLFSFPFIFVIFYAVQLECFKSWAAGVDGVDLSGSPSQPVM